jgi:hypothetical protein
MTNRGQDAGGATSNSSAGLCLAGRCTRGKFDGALPGSPCRHDLRGHPNYGSRDGHDHRFAPELPLEVAVLPRLPWGRR